MAAPGREHFWSSKLFHCSKSSVCKSKYFNKFMHSSGSEYFNRFSYGRGKLLIKIAIGSAGILSICVAAKLRSRGGLLPSSTPSASSSSTGAISENADNHRLSHKNFLARHLCNFTTVNAATNVKEREDQNNLGIKSIGIEEDLSSTTNRSKSSVSNVSRDSAVVRPWHFDNPSTKQVRHSKDRGPVNLTLYQYVTCPFCCKVRAYLDYYGIDYNIVEVDSIRRTQKKWTSYRKVPVLVYDGVGPDGFLQMNDSSMIISALDSHRVSKQEADLAKLLSYYPVIESKEGKKTVYDFPNRYFIMFEDKHIEKGMAELREEREWRQWVDDNLVHTLSPNAYRTLPEAIESFRWFSEVGDWENCMSTWSRLTCIYSGALVMWAIGGRLKRRYGLEDDVRQSLYKSVNDWLEGIGPDRKFMGGDKPNLADLAVYGVMCSIEGCQAFKDLSENTEFQKWYKPMKAEVQQHKGRATKSHAEGK